ncbi:hypothetical protein C3L33_02461, partial [Rhododendron williamsianum]
MLGEFITRLLILVLGYAYPAFECFKTMEKNRVEMHELRFWCQYWVIVAVLTVFERVVDMFMSWCQCSEMKLALISTCGIQDKELTSLGQTKFFEIVQFISAQFGKVTKANNETADQHLQRLANQPQQKNERHDYTPSAPPLSPPRSSFSLFPKQRKQPPDNRRRPPMSPPPGNAYW